MINPCPAICERAFAGQRKSNNRRWSYYVLFIIYFFPSLARRYPSASVGKLCHLWLHFRLASCYKPGGLSSYASLRIHFFLSIFPGALQPFYRRRRTREHLLVI